MRSLMTDSDNDSETDLESTQFVETDYTDSDLSDDLMESQQQHCISSDYCWNVLAHVLVGCIVVGSLIFGAVELVNSKSNQDATMKSGKCSNGPYVFDPSHHLEGIGSTFQWRKQGLILANAFECPWIGLLENAHDTKPRINHAIDMFGLSDPNDCDFDTLMQITKSDKTGKWNIHQGEEMMNISEMCSGQKSGMDYRKQFNLDQHSIIIAPEQKHATENLNFCVFNERFRDRYHTQQQIAGMIPKPKNEFWISVHFRMRDGTNEPDNARNGWRNLEQLAKDTAVYVNKFPNAKIFFISEGSNERIYANFKKIVPNVQFLLDLRWEDALWKMANSNVLLGGGSSFFEIGVHLNDQSCLADKIGGEKCVKLPSVPQSAVNVTLVSAKDFA